MSLQVKVNIPDINIGKSVERIHKEMTAYSLEALKTWVIHTTDIIPVWSGGTKASFIKAASQAKLSLEIVPVAPTPPGSRIDLGIADSNFEFFAQPGGEYGWDWSSVLFYIDIVENRVRFLEAGEAALRGLAEVELPQPVFEE